MKKHFLKSMLCMVCSVAMIIGDAGISLAAGSVSSLEILFSGEENSENTEEERQRSETETIEAADEIPKVFAANKTEVFNLSGSINPAYLQYSFEGNAYRYDIYINNSLIDTQYKPIDNVDQPDNNDENIVTPDDTDEDLEVPDENLGLYRDLEYKMAANDIDYYNDRYLTTVYPGTYTVKVVPYDKDGNKGISQSYTYDKIPMNACTEFDIYATYSEIGHSGYYKPGMKVDIAYGEYPVDITLYRSTKQNGSYKEVKTIQAKSSLNFIDYDISPNKTYYYYAVSSVPETDFLPGKTGKKTAVVSRTFEFSAECSVYLDSDNRPVIEAHSSNGIGSSYEILRATRKNGSYKTIATLTDSYKYTDISAQTNKAYYYKVRPYYYDIFNEKKLAGKTSTPFGVKIVLGNFSDVKVKDLSETSAQVSWNKVSGADGYEVYLKLDACGDAYKKVAVTTKTSCVLKKLQSGEAYFIQVRAYKKSNHTAAYFTSSETMMTAGFKAPENVVCKTSSYTYSKEAQSITFQQKITWNRVYGAKGYKIYRDGELVKTIPSGITTSYSFKQTVKGNKGNYGNYVVAAYKGKEEHATPVGCYPGLDAPTGIKITQKGSNGVKISWKAVKGANYYTIYRFHAVGGYSSYLGQTDKTIFTDDDLTPGVTYGYTIAGYNDVIGIDSISSASKKIQLKVEKPVISSVKNESAGKAVIKWKNVEVASAYVIYRADSKNGTYSKVGTTKKINYTDSKLTKGKTYYYKVAAQTVNSAGTKVRSDKSTAKSVKISR